jgi:dTDP-4-amino-4,6-dideoxygalactose transaminase
MLPFSKPTIGVEEIDAVADVLRSGWLTTGKQAKAFEEEFAEYVNARHALAVSSNTAGMSLVLAALEIGPEDEVICPAYTFSSPAMEILHTGATPVFVDNFLSTFNPDPDAIQRAITKRTKAILVVHFAGLPCDLAAVQSIARKEGLPVIEDAAHALPAWYYGRKIGSSGSLATVFSFYANKTITTAEGGMVTTNDPVFAKKLSKFRLHGIDRDVFDRYTTGSAGWAYDIVAPGFKANMPDVLAAIGRVQLQKSDALWRRRVEIASFYLSELADCPGLILPPKSSFDVVSAWHLFVVRTQKRDELFAYLRKHDIGASVHFIPLPMFSFWQKRLGVDPADYPNAYRLFHEVLSLPLFPLLTEAEAGRVVSVVRSFFEEFGND